MSRAEPLPEHLRGASFRVGTALQAGVTADQLRRNSLRSEVWGVRDDVDTAPTIARRCLSFATRLGAEMVFSDETAAVRWPLPLPLHLSRSTLVHVTVQKGKRAPHAAGIVGHQRLLRPDEVAHRDGTFLTTPARTLCDLASRLTLVEAVAIADVIVSARKPLATLDQLNEEIRRYPGRRGRVRLQEVTDRVDGGAESPKETETRLLLQDAGFPRTTTNVRVRDGLFRARIDLSYPQWKIAIEYEGDYHRKPDEWRKTQQRRRRLEALGWIYISVTQADLDDPRHLFYDLAAAIARRTR